jgi:hypothetical protein
LIRCDSKGRVLVAAGQRDALLDAFEQSGQSAMAFCRQHGLKYPTFATWVQKRRRGGEPGRPRFAGPWTYRPWQSHLLRRSPCASRWPASLRIDLAYRKQLGMRSTRHPLTG